MSDENKTEDMENINVDCVESVITEQSDNIKPSDSVSQVNSKCSSSVLKMQAMARKAALQAKAKVLLEKQRLRRQKMDLEQKEQQLDLEEEIAVVEAEAEVYENIEHYLKNEVVNPVVAQSVGNYNQSCLVSDKPHAGPSTGAPLNPMSPEFLPKNKQTQELSDRPINLDNIHQGGGHRDCQHKDSFHSSSPPVLIPFSGTAAPSIKTSEETVIQLQQQMLEVMQLPKTELITFDGDPLKYWMFISAFDNSVGHTAVNDSIKLNRLFQYVRGRALQVIECCSVMDPRVGYHEARRLLSERFGNPFVIAKSWVDKITGGPFIKPSENETLRRYADDVRSCVITLKAMDRINEIDNQERMVKIVAKLPPYMQGRWRREAVRSLKAFGQYPQIEQLVEFIEMAADEANDPVFGSKVTGAWTNSSPYPNNKVTGAWTNSSPYPNKNKGSNFYVHTEDNNYNKGDSGVLKCHMCCGEHALFKCDKFRQMTTEDRLNFVRGKRLCFNCFSTKHASSFCQRDSRCNVRGCSRKHSRSLHVFSPKSANGVDHTQKQRPFSELPATGTCMLQDSSCGATGAGKARVALPIVPVMVRANDKQTFIQTYALLDSGSTNTFCSESLIDQLGITGTNTKLSLTTLGKQDSQSNVIMTSLEVTDLSGRNGLSLPCVFSTPSLPVLSGSMANQSDIDRWPHFKGIHLPHIDKSNVTLLIGQDVPVALIPHEVRYGKGNEPYATKTVFGWTVNGPLNTNRRPGKVINNFIQADHDLEIQVERFWKLDSSESLADNKMEMSVNDKRVIHLWDRTTKLENGHYHVDIPFKRSPPSLPNNYSSAESRLQYLGRRLAKDPALNEKYKTEIDRLLDKGYAERVTRDTPAIQGKVWYLPHHPVKNVNKPDKLRVVFDCSAKYGGMSLNSEVLQGPDLTNNLVGVLLRFREEQIAVMGDVEAMFHQVKVPPKDRDVLRFLWWKDGNPDNSVEQYRMTSHLFGGVWCPSCATYALRRTAEDNRDDFDFETINSVSKNFYVDDCLKSVATEDQAINIVNQLGSVLRLAGFNLTKWASNSRKVLECIPTENKAAKIQDLDFDKSLPVERALGIQWHTESDTFGIRVVQNVKPITRRGLISVISSVYDPLGFISPVILKAKIIFQDETRLKKGWDEPLNVENIPKWNTWVKDCPKLEQLQLQRCVIPPDFRTPVVLQLHHFSDASEQGYGAVSYLRIVNSEGKVHCSFLISKSRLAPIKAITIPRLELSAAVLSVKLDVMLRRQLSLDIHRSVFWTDSTIVLHYIRSESKRFHTFVANRLAVIHDGSTAGQWKYVDTKNNPADHASRGLTADAVMDNNNWINGPEFLWNVEASWPIEPASVNQGINLDHDKEVKHEAKVYTTTDSCQTHVIDRLLQRYSSWYKLKRAVAWLLRFKCVLKGKAFPECANVAQSAYLKAVELQEAELAIIKYVQLSNFSEEIEYLRSDRDRVVKRSSSLASLEPFVNSIGLLCVGGRLDRAPIEEESKHQVILPKNHYIVNLIVRSYHELFGHCGKEFVLSEIRRKYWVINARPTVKKILNSCVHCKLRYAKLGTQRMANLPEDRVTPNKPPFTNVGVDCFGPFEVKRGRSVVKRYGCLFTCLSIRAIHIEKLDSMGTDSFINAFKRFECRRGRPDKIRSDNGTNFKGGEREMREAVQNWNQQKIAGVMCKNEIEWQFNPPAASHMGGVWERQVRTVRKVLNSLLARDQSLQDEDLTTLFCEVESIVNSRPITAVSDNPKDLEPLTPNHLLLLRSGTQFPFDNFHNEDRYRKRWRHVQCLADSFWKRWLREYLPTLQLRQKWLVPKRNLCEGDVVLLLDSSAQRLHWPLGRVVKTFPGQDGLVRSVQIKTQSALLTRPITKLCLIESAPE